LHGINTDYLFDRIYRIFSCKGIKNAKTIQKCQKLSLTIQIDRPGPQPFSKIKKILDKI